MTVLEELDEVLAVIRGYRYTFASEAGLADALEDVLREAGLVPERERVLDARSRLDLLVGGVAIEVKVGSDPADVYRQLRRYAAYPCVEGIILVTSRVRHSWIPDVIDGIPVRVHNAAMMF